MDGGEDQVILILVRHAGLIAGGAGRIEREFSQETFAAGKRAGNAFELRQVAFAGVRIIVEPFEMRLEPVGRQRHIGRPDGTGISQLQIDGAK